MWRYILKRLLWLIVTMVAVGILIFTIMYFVPGDPAKIILGNTGVTEADYEAYRELHGLNDPYVVQLGRFMYQAFLRLDFGESYTYRTSVWSMLLERIPRTLALAWICIVLTAVIGIPLGIVCATYRNSVLDRFITTLTMIGISMPAFWFALMLVVLFSVNLGILPPYGIGSWKNWIMPIAAGSVGGIAVNVRQTRSSILETMNADFVTTARAKGVPERSVKYKHMLPNGLIPVISVLGGEFARSIGGTVVIESVFTFPGVGLFMLNAINSRDYPVVRGCVMVLALFSAVAMLLVDLCYAYLDPRIKEQYVNSGKRKKKI